MPALTEAEVVAFVRDRVLPRSARRASAHKWLEYYQGDQLKHIPCNRDESPAHFAGRPKCTLNITRRIIDAKSCLYDEGTVRDCADPDVRRFWQEVDIDQRMREADPVVRLCGTFFVRPDFVVPTRSFWSQLRAWFFTLAGGQDPAEDGRFIWLAYPASMVEVLLDPDYPEIPLALAISWRAAIGKPMSVQVWTASDYWRLEDDKLLGREAHGFGRIPFVVFRNDPDWTQDFWGRAEAPNVVPQNEEINRLVSSLQWLVINQSHGQWKAKNPPTDWQAVMGTDQVVCLYGDPSRPDMEVDLELVAPVAKSEELKNTIDWNLDKICEVNDVPAGTYRLDQNRQSGSSLVEKRVATFQYRKRRRPQALGWERELAALSRIVKAARTHPGQPLPAGIPQIRVDYREPEMPQGVGEVVQREQHELQTGQATVPELLMRHNPDLSREEAERAHEENEAYNQAHQAASVEAALPAEGAGAGPASADAQAQAAAALAAAAGGPTA